MHDKWVQVEGWLLADRSLVEKVERDRAYRQRERQRSHHKAGKNGKGTVTYRQREFVFWDGEGPRDGGYALFGNSLGMEVCHANLSTKECLDLIIQTDIEYPNRIHLIFGGNYDASMMLHDLSWRHMSALKSFNKTMWQGYEIQYVSRHWLRIRAQGRDIRIFDIVSFFASDFVGALRNFKIRTQGCLHGTDRCKRDTRCDCLCLLCGVEYDKNHRAEFRMAQIQEIAIYMRHELELGVELANELRRIFLDAGFDPRSWHGPGALARMALNRHHVKDAMAESPPDVRIAARYAFAGGRFELFKAGHFKRDIYNADINSAYPYFASMLPNLAKGKWRRTKRYEHGKFAVYYIQYATPPKRTLESLCRPYPLFRRHATGHVEWPSKVEGWYWNPEAALVWNDPNAKFIEGWVFDEEDSNDRPFSFIVDYYHKRQVLKNSGSAAEFTFKLIINSIYGQLAQRTGWDRKERKSPKFHQLEWAGWITSSCRAYIYTVARSCGDSLISIDTDGIYSLSPIPVTNCGKELGQWDKSEYRSGVFWQSGIYALKSGDGWTKAKTRGISKGTYSPEAMIEAIKSGGMLTMIRRAFIGFGLALNGRRNDLNTWESEEVGFVFGGQGKRYHNTRGCKNGTTCSNGIHRLLPVPRATKPNETTASKPHFIPWLENDPLVSSVKNAHFDLVAFDVNDLDADDAWTVKEIKKDSSIGLRVA